MTDQEKLDKWDNVMLNYAKMSGYIDMMDNFVDDMQACGKLTQEDFRLWTMKYEAKLTVDKMMKEAGMK